MSSALASSASTHAVWELEEYDAAEWRPPLRLVSARSVRANGDPQIESASTWTPSPLDVEAEFEILADELAAAAQAVSATRRLVGHPAYIGILSFGKPTIPLLLARLQTRRSRPLWLSLLGSIEALPPSAGEETIEDAADAWLRWGKTEGHLK